MLASSESRNRHGGFTLIELTLVLIIVGILASLAMPSLSALGVARIDADARRLAAVISYLHDEAALRGRVYRLTLDIDDGAYAVAVAREDTGEFVSPGTAEGWDPYAPESRVLADGVRIALVRTATGTVSAGASTVYFLPEDARESFTIVLVSTGGGQRILDADGITGRVEVASAPRA